LKNGETYFAVLYVDEDGVVPTLESLVFIGKDDDPGDEGKLYFQDYGCVLSVASRCVTKIGLASGCVASMKATAK
jgi:hypothetical protein